MAGPVTDAIVRTGPARAPRPTGARRARATLRGPRARRGAALVVAIVLLVVIDCIVIGTVHLAILERRVADNGALALRLRLAAESGVRLAAAQWPPAFDSILPGDAPLAAAVIRTVDGLETYGTVERLGGELYLVRATAQRPAPHAGRAAAAMLVLPPAVRHGLDPAAAALTAATVHVGATGVIDTGDQECGNGEAAAVLLLGGVAPVVHDGASLNGSVEYIGEDRSLARDMPRIAAALAGTDGRNGTTFVAGDVHVTETMNGVLAATGDITITAHASFHGLLISGGSLTIEESGSLRGAAHAYHDAAIHGFIQLDACSVRDAAWAAELHRSRPLPSRPWIPSF